MARLGVDLSVRRSGPPGLLAGATLVWAIIALFGDSIASAQVRWTVTNATVNLAGDANADDWNVAGVDTVNCAETALVGGWQGYSYGIDCYRRARQASVDPRSFCQAEIMGKVTVDGDGAWEIAIEWNNIVTCRSGAPNGYAADALMQLDTTVDMEITDGPAGEPVIVYFNWEGIGAAYTRHEAVMEDPVNAVNGVISINGVDQLMGRFDFQDPPGLSGFSSKKNQTGTMMARVGDTITISVNSDLDAQINVPPAGILQGKDNAWGQFRGRIRLTVGFPPSDPPPPTPPGGLASLANTNTYIEFSLDIGSDTELSDPLMDGDEVFDPGDAYEWQGLPVLPGDNGIKDDADIFMSFDPWPDPADLASGAPVCLENLPSDVQIGWFDLDGHDNLDVSLAPFLGPALGPIEFFDSACIFPARFLIISYDDDEAEHYVGAAGNCEIPVWTTSPMVAATYGTTALKDEIIGLIVSPGSPAISAFEYPIADEEFMHVSLFANPDASEEEDDDVDSLDIPFIPANCSFWYFSVDHEATYFDPFTLVALDAGGIYEVVAGGLPVQVIDEAFHLGIPEETDIDAFEFVWIDDPISGGPHLALLYSVDDDDPLTAGDESGGLDPTMLYASFLDGASFEYLSSPLLDDVDGLTAWNTDLIPPPTAGACCGPAGCLFTDSSGCFSWGGTYMGDGTDCVDINLNGEADECECLTCRGDLEGDLDIDTLDMQMFVACLVGSPGALNCGCADLDANGTLDTDDVTLFVIELVQGPIFTCP